ncbi:hypothetical protein XA68_11072 [Ophiocordyceps unilateralis]|uniref:Zn(2)-C6 fungal-type domain-containing protein n=1 Tax=Ophiocordyceps unilateralis TaxID=268505 RepID=A0A2A9PHK9_OPHUN|nr:hypothetical protein XA68_11072 [Ophiocordyceps unilateralis]
MTTAALCVSSSCGTQQQPESLPSREQLRFNVMLDGVSLRADLSPRVCICTSRLLLSAADSFKSVRPTSRLFSAGRCTTCGYARQPRKRSVFDYRRPPEPPSHVDLLDVKSRQAQPLSRADQPDLKRREKRHERGPFALLVNSSPLTCCRPCTGQPRYSSGRRLDIHPSLYVAIMSGDTLLPRSPGSSRVRYGTGEQQATSSPAPKQRRATRAKFSKPTDSKGGIGKGRHIKCDETKPYCRNCIKWAGFCSGYERRDETLTHRPRQPTDVEAAASPSPPRVLDESFWIEAVPRLIRDSPAVRRANSAVQALVQSKTASSRSSYKVALTDYGQALQAARQASAQREADLREAIVCSMFFVVFEAINGDQPKAEAHLLNGQRVLNALGYYAPQSLRHQIRHVVGLVGAQGRAAVQVGELTASFVNCGY